jgi:glycine/D-amino acid oxidase-like deaminating enzyme
VKLTCDIAIVGAGIVGTACAYYLAQEGLKVIVIERGPVGGGSTGSCMGHIVVLHDSVPHLALTSFGRQLWQQISLGLPEGVEYNQCGTIWLATTQQQIQQLRSQQTYYNQYGIATQLLDQDALCDAEPCLRKGVAGGLYVPDDAVIYPPAAACYLLAMAQSNGAMLLQGCQVMAIGPDGSIRLQGNQIIYAGIIINAAGCWASQLDRQLPIIKRKGHLAVTDRSGAVLRHQVVEVSYLQSVRQDAGASVAFNVQPRKTGQILIGSSRQIGAEGTEVEMPVLAHMLQRAVEWMPILANLKVIRAWAGHRPSTPDHLPMIGPCPGNERVWLATGHEGLGLTTSLATAHLIANMIAGRPCQIDPGPYLPGRLLQGTYA